MGAETADDSVIDGQGCWWWAQRMRGTLEICRPQLLNFVSCSNVEITGVTLKDPPFWNTHLWNSSSVAIHDMRIHAAVKPSCAPPSEKVRAVNSDGIDVDSSSDVLIERVYIEADDDAVAIKSGAETSRFVQYPYQNPICLPRQARDKRVRNVVMNDACQCCGASAGMNKPGQEFGVPSARVTVRQCVLISNGQSTIRVY